MYDSVMIYYWVNNILTVRAEEISDSKNPKIIKSVIAKPDTLFVFYTYKPSRAYRDMCIIIYVYIYSSRNIIPLCNIKK